MERKGEKQMNFLEALKKCNYETHRVRSSVVSAKNDGIKDRVKIYRPEWAKIKYPAKFVWVTQQNIPVVSVGNNQSMPLMLEVPDFIAEDWEILIETED
jgi:hypothetical protein